MSWRGFILVLNFITATEGLLLLLTVTLLIAIVGLMP